MRRMMRILAAGGAAVLMLSPGCDNSHGTQGDSQMQRHVVLVGASVGQEWNLAGLPARAGVRESSFESIAAYQFDKGEAVGDLLLRPRRRFRPTRTYLRGFFKPAPRVPDVVILKECAAYFPGDLPSYQSRFPGWVQRLRARNIRVVVATVVPVTREHATARPGRIEAIRQFNDWLRAYASRERLDLLDLEAALREDGGERYLDGKYTSGDGLHLNRTGYDLLDRRLLQVLGPLTEDLKQRSE